jgi:hypothetical protein
MPAINNSVRLAMLVMILTPFIHRTALRAELNFLIKYIAIIVPTFLKKQSRYLRAWAQKHGNRLFKKEQAGMLNRQTPYAIRLFRLTVQK